MKSGTEQAVEFLRSLYPNGIWALTSIDPFKKQNIETRSFTDAEAMSAWIDKFNGMRNIYFHVNQPKDLISKKATKDVMGAAYFLHADIDPRANEDVEAEQSRIAKLIEEWPFDLPEPHIVVFSGGGYQAFWRLEEKFEIGGSVELCEEFERYNRTIEQVLDADNCHNVDRIMRVPGTMNIPDETKLKKGRRPVMACAIRIEEGSIPLSAVPPATKKQDLGDNSKRLEIDGSAERIDDLDVLDQYGISNYIKVVIAQGALPREECTDSQLKFTRSDWVFKVLCEFVRCDVPDKTAFSIITDRRWPISDHIYAQRTPAEKYAIRQIERAHDFTVDPMLEHLNTRYCVIQKLGGRCMIIERVFDKTMGREQVLKQSPTNFEQAWRNRKVEVGKKQDGSPIHKKAGTWWLDHPHRRQFGTMAFNPKEPSHYDDVYNLWDGFAVDPAPGDKHRSFLEHIRDNVCDGDKRIYQYVLGWMARCVQYPGTPGETAIVLRGRQGTGKTFIAEHFGKLFGQHYLPVADGNHLVGNFNSHLRDVVFLFADEAFYAGDRKHRSILKTLVTSHVLAYEAKGIDVESGPNCVHLMMASNDKWVVPAEVDDRRFLVLDVADHRANDSKYFGAIAEGMADGGYASLLFDLLKYDLSRFNVRDLIDTAAKVEQKLLSLTATRKAVYELLRDGDPDALAIRDRDVFIATKVLLDEAGLPSKALTELGKELGKAAGMKCRRFKESDGGNKTPVFQEYVSHYGQPQPRGVWMPSLHQARMSWAEANRLDIDWPEGVDWICIEEDEDDLPY